MLTVGTAKPIRNEDVQGSADHLGPGVTKDLLRTIVEYGDPLLVIDGDDCIGGNRYDSGKLCFRYTQRLLSPLAFRDVFNLSDVVEWGAISTAKNRGAEQNINGRPVLADVALSELASGNLPTSKLVQECEIGVEILGMGDGLKSEFCQLGRAVAHDLAERTIDTDETSIKGNQCHPYRRFIDREPKSLFRFLQRLFDALALADVAHERLPAPVRQDLGAHLDGNRCAVLPDLRPFGHLDHAC